MDDSGETTGSRAVGHVRPDKGESHLKLRHFKKIFLERSPRDIEQSLFRWDSYSGRSPSNKKDVLRHANMLLKWKNDRYHHTGGLFCLTFDDMKNYNAILREPVVGKYRNYKIYGMGPPSSGGINIFQMLICQR